MREEWLAYYQYWVGAQVIEGPMRRAIQKEFMKHAGEELEHAGWLATRIIQLGGTPVLSPGDWEKVAVCRYISPENPFDVELLKQNLASERCAVKRYQENMRPLLGQRLRNFFNLAQNSSSGT